MTPTPTVLSYGEIMWDLLPNGPVLGGAPVNFAYRLRSLGCPAQVITRIGVDPPGDKALNLLKALKLDLSLLQRDPSKPTGKVPITLDPDGVPDFEIIPDVAFDYIETTPELQAAARSSAVFCYGTLVQRSEVSRNTLYNLLEHAADAIKVLDINLRKNCFSADTVLRSLSYADILKLNQDEVSEVARFTELPADSLSEFCHALLKKFGLSTCLVTRGPHGVFGVQRSGAVVDLPGYAVTVSDTVGSGDSFTAGFVYQLLQGSTFQRCCEFGNILGALTAARAGGMSQISWDEIKDFESTHGAS